MFKALVKSLPVIYGHNSMVGLLAVMVNRKNLTDEQLVRLNDYLLEHLANNELPRGILKAGSVEFSVTRQTWFLGYGKGGMRHVPRL
jgi:hypothetical protein